MALLLAFMTCLTFVQVVLRYLFDSSLIWSLETTTYCFAWLVLIGMSYGVRTHSHIAVDLVVYRLPSPQRRIAVLLAVALCLVYALLMGYGSYLFVERLLALGNAARDIPLKKWLLTALMPLAFTLLAFRFAQLGLRMLRGHDIDRGFAKRNVTAAVMEDPGRHGERNR